MDKKMEAELMVQLRQELSDFVNVETANRERLAKTKREKEVRIAESGMLRKIVPQINDKYQNLVHKIRRPFKDLVREELRRIMESVNYSSTYYSDYIGNVYFKYLNQNYQPQD